MNKKTATTDVFLIRRMREYANAKGYDIKDMCMKLYPDGSGHLRNEDHEAKEYFDDCIILEWNDIEEALHKLKTKHSKERYE